MTSQRRGRVHTTDPPRILPPVDPVRHAALRALGLKNVTLQQLMADHGDAIPLRVCRVDRGQCSVMGVQEDGSPTTLRVRPPVDPVAVGDWVLLDGDDPSRIGSILERTTVLRRGSVGVEGREQLIAANLDVVFVVTAFAATEKLERRGLNPRRLERYVAAVGEGGAQPVAVCNKVDLSESEGLEDLRRDLSARLGNLDVIFVSAHTRNGLDELRRYLVPGDTVAFVGPSGVGKSSLINTLVGRAAAEVGEVRTLDAKGRHTTSHRELLVMPGGALLVDTPGMRAFAVLTDTGEVSGFDDIQALAEGCRFSDCAHDSEPGCAVQAAVARGELPADRLANLHALQRDAQRLHAKQDGLARHEARKKDRAFGRLVREAKDLKKR